MAPYGWLLAPKLRAVTLKVRETCSLAIWKAIGPPLE